MRHVKLFENFNKFNRLRALGLAELPIEPEDASTLETELGQWMSDAPDFVDDDADEDDEDVNWGPTKMEWEECASQLCDYLGARPSDIISCTPPYRDDAYKEGEEFWSWEHPIYPSYESLYLNTAEWRGVKCAVLSSSQWARLFFAVPNPNNEA